VLSLVGKHSLSSEDQKCVATPVCAMRIARLQTDKERCYPTICACHRLLLSYIYLVLLVVSHTFEVSSWRDERQHKGLPRYTGGMDPFVKLREPAHE
jgi:hypothetical protein